MKKKILLLLATATMLMGCAATAQPETSTAETTIETSAEESTSEELPDGLVEIKMDTSTGVYKSKDTATDANGEYERYTFVDKDGNEFIAVISDYTEIVDEMVEGNNYLVTHSEVMTMSLPPIYPQVYQILRVNNEGVAEIRYTETESVEAESIDETMETIIPDDVVERVEFDEREVEETELEDSEAVPAVETEEGTVAE